MRYIESHNFSEERCDKIINGKIELTLQCNKKINPSPCVALMTLDTTYFVCLHVIELITTLYNPVVKIQTLKQYHQVCQYMQAYSDSERYIIHGKIEPRFSRPTFQGMHIMNIDLVLDILYLLISLCAMPFTSCQVHSITSCFDRRFFGCAPMNGRNEAFEL